MAVTETIVYHHAYVASDEGILVIIKGYRGNGSIVVVHFLDRGNMNAPVAAFLSAISYCGPQEQIALKWRCPICEEVNSSEMSGEKHLRCRGCRGSITVDEAIEQGSLRVSDRYSGDAIVDCANEREFGVVPVPFASIFGAPAIRH